MKRLFSLFLILCSLSGWSQTVVQRAGAANTVNDPRHMASLNEYIPTYNDTTEANLPAHIGIDSAGAVIYTYDAKSFWYRQHAPKKWVRLSPYWNLGFGLTAPNDYTVEADTAALATLWDLNQAVTAPGLSTDTSGRTYYVANGLAARNDSTHILGGTLDEATTIALNGKAFTLSQENGSYTKWNNYSNSFPQWEFYHRHTDGSWTDMYNYSTGIVTGIVASAKRAAASGQVQLNLQSMNDNNYALLKTEWSSAAGYTSFGQKSTARDSTTSIAMYRSFGSGKGAAARLDSTGIHLLVGDATFLTKGVSVEQGTGQVLATSLKTTATAPVQVGTTKYVTTDTLGRLSFADGPSGAGTDTSGHAMIWAQNGLSKRNDSTTILGGTLDQHTTETLAGYQLTFNGTGSWSYLDSRFWWNPGGAFGSYEDTYAKGTLSLSEETFTTRVAFKDGGAGGGTGYQEVKVNGEELALYASNTLGLAHLDLFGGVTGAGTAPNPLAIRLGIYQTGVEGQMGVNLTKDSLTLGYDPADQLGANFGAIKIGQANDLRLPAYAATRADGLTASALYVDGGGNVLHDLVAPVRTMASTSSAATNTLSAGGEFIFTGTTSTWTLPTVAGNFRAVIWIYNRGSGAITLNANSGGNDIYSAGAAVSTVSVAAGSWVRLVNDNAYWLLYN
jgi:hypothetical protein